MVSLRGAQMVVREHQRARARRARIEEKGGVRHLAYERFVSTYRRKVRERLTVCTSSTIECAKIGGAVIATLGGALSESFDASVLADGGRKLERRNARSANDEHVCVASAHEHAQVSHRAVQCTSRRGGTQGGGAAHPVC
jgi:hypothetical protein